MGLANRIVEPGLARTAAQQLGVEIARFPQMCMRNDRRSVLEQWGLDFDTALRHEFGLGMQTVASGETQSGANSFTAGAGRHGSFGEPA